MTTEEIQQYIEAALGANFTDFHAELGEMMTSPEGDGRFHGKVIATRYTALPGGRALFLAIGETALKVQIVKLGKSECLKPERDDLDALLLKELGVKKDG